MGIPVGVYLSPVLLALTILVADLVNFVIPTADVGGAVWSLLDRLIDGDPGTIATIAMILVIWVIPGIITLVVLYVVIAWRLRRIGGEGLALGIGARPPRNGDLEETQLGDVVTEYSIAAGIAPPTLLLYDSGPANAFVYGRDHDHATVVVARDLLDVLDREEAQGVVARLIASAVDGDVGLAVDIGAVYVTFGLVTTTLAAIVSRTARARWRAAIGPLVGRHGTPQRDAAGIAALLGLAADDDQPSNAAGGCLTLLTMGGFIGIGVALINLFLSGPLLTLAWRARGYLADATSVELTRDPDGLARALAKLDTGGSVPGTAWLELLLVVGSASGGSVVAGSVPRLSDTGLAVSLAPSVRDRRRRLGEMGAASVDTSSSSPSSTASRFSGGRRRLPTIILIAVIGPLIALVGILAAIAAALLVWLIALAAFVDPGDRRRPDQRTAAGACRSLTVPR